MNDVQEDTMTIRVFRAVCLLLCCWGIMFPPFCQAGPPSIPGFYGTVKWDAKTMKSVTDQAQFRSVVQGAQNPVYSNNRVDINQTQEKAILEWNSFNVPPEVSVNFNQAASSWVALNRIYDKNPSYIFGNINAIGKVYLINQNGILFGQGSKVNVNTLVASALNITNANFLKSILASGHDFKLEDYQGTGMNYLATISNQGTIDTMNGGAAFLMAPRVDNSGSISAPAGQIGLIAGTEVTLMHSATTDTERSGYYVLIKDDFVNNPQSNDASFGKAVNLGSGSLAADGGIAGIYGNNVENWGTIRSVTAFKNNRGMVELRAANTVTTGEGSAIFLPVDASIDPETGTIATVDDSFDIQPKVYIGGLQRLSNTGSYLDSSAKRIEHRGNIRAPAGVVAMEAVDRIYLETGSSIDVSGVEVELPADILSAKLNSLELRDVYGQKTGVLLGTTVTTSDIAGSAVGDLSKIIISQARTALERSIGGAPRTIVDQNTGTINYNNRQTGIINLTAAGDLIVKQGAVLDFSGGGASYTSGFYDATKLLSNNKIYDIANAPLYLNYDRIMGSYTKKYDRFGVKDTYTGMYYGGASSLKSRVEGYRAGGDAGSLNLSAARIVLDGTLNGGVTKGTYQNTWTMRGSYSSDSDYDLGMALSVRRGLEAPRAGSLTIDTQGVTDGNGRESSISLLSDTAPQTDITADTPLSTKTTVLSAKILNAAGLGILDLKANLSISAGEDAAINLQPGGSFSAEARRIDHQGKITVPGGAISLVAAQNKTTAKNAAGEDNPSAYIVNMPDKEGIILASTSRLDASGEKIDNSMRAGRSNEDIGFGHTTGGNISIKDKTDDGAGVSIMSGAAVDVSGGYAIDQKGKVTGGSAGLLDIQGSNIALDGNLRGYALSDTNGKLLGGSVTLRTTNIRVAPEACVMPGAFVLSGDRFRDTGFTQIALYSRNDVIIEQDTAIEPSLMRMICPIPGQSAGSVTSDRVTPAVGYAVPDFAGLMRLNDSMAFMAGPSSFTVSAGRSFEGTSRGFTGNLMGVSTDVIEARVLISPGAVVRTAPAVTGVTRIANDVGSNPGAVKTGITITGGNVEIGGVLESLGGQISVSSASTLETTGNLSVSQQAQIRAAGYNRPDLDSTLKNYSMNYLPVTGGAVVLSATGNLALTEGSQIDISGSDTVENRLRMTNGKIYTFSEAGEPGSLTLSFGKSLRDSGAIKVKNPGASIPGIRGGALILGKTENAAASSKTLDIGDGDGQVDIRRYIGAGFDDITLKGYNSIQFHGAIEPAAGHIGRKLTLDAPVISGNGQDVNLSAPWVLLTNSTAPGSPGEVTGGGLTISGEWIDVTGAVNIGGFHDVTLQAGRDIRLNEALYDLGGGAAQKGGTLATKGNVTLDADRVYPGGFYSFKKDDANNYTGTYSDFVITADKKVTIQRSASHVGGFIYSAGGNITVEGNEGIEVKQGGYLAAPLGTITLKAAGNRIYLADGGTVSTSGSNDAAVKYGFLDDGNLWMTVPDKISLSNNTPVGSGSLADKRVLLDADTVIVRSGAVIDVAGGGSLFAYKFQPGTAGSQDPLTKANRYLIFKDNSYQFPGAQVYLQRGGGLSEGIYTLLPLNSANAKYAFMTDAYIIEVQKNSALPVSGKTALSKDGYPLTVGYQAVADTSIRGTRPQVYSIRKAADVLALEGNYVRPSLVAGNAGSIGITGETTILEGTLKGIALEGYSGGTVSLSAANVIVRQNIGNLLPENFDFNGIVGTDLQNKLILSASGISGMGFREVGLGDKDSTATVTVESGLPDKPTVLNASIISLAAKDKIEIQTNAQINAVTGKDKDSGEGVINLTTPGNLTIGKDALVHATHDITLDINDVTGIQGNLLTDGSSVTLKSENIFFFDRGTSTANGLYVTNDVWKRFSGFEDIAFAGGSIQFKGGTVLSTTGSLTLDAANILDMKTDGASTVTLTAPTVNILNSAAVTSSTTAAKADADSKGTFTVSAARGVNIGGGDVLFNGFKTINLFSGNDLSVKGIGSLTTGSAANGYADLNITAARVVTGSDSGSDKKYIAPRFTIDAGTAAVTMTGVTGISPAVSTAPGGLLEIVARRIEISTTLQSDGGTINLATVGSAGMDDDGVFLGDGGQILARGTDDAPGGRVLMLTDYIDESGVTRSGRIELAAGSLIDVSAGGQGDAGLIRLSAPIGGVSINGNLSGTAGTKYKAVGDFVESLTGNALVASLTISAGNNAIGFTYNGTDYTATVQPGSYATGSDLAAALQTALNSAKDAAGNTVPGTPFTVVHGTASGKLTVKNKDTCYAVTNFMTTADNTLPASQMGFACMNGVSGSFELDAKQLSSTDMTQLIGTLATGGFSESLDIRARQGNIELASGQTLQAHTVKLTADDGAANSGNISISGTIDASAPDGGGRVELYAKNDVNVNGCGVIYARGTAVGANGGNVLLSAANGYVNVKSGSAVDVSGGTEGTGGTGGTVSLRALRNGNDVQMSLNGMIVGVSKLTAEAVRVYDNVSNIDAEKITAWNEDTNNFMNNSGAIKTRLLANLTLQGADSGSLHVIPGVELRNEGDITLGADWDFTQGWRYGSENDPGVLTIRAGGNLGINNNLVDHPTAVSDLLASTAKDSWGFNLTAGADVGSANYMSVKAGLGDLSIADGKAVYTEKASISFASGNDTTIGLGGNPGYMIMEDGYSIGMKYNLAAYDGAVQGAVGRDLIINGGAIQTAVGDITISTGRDLQLNMVSGYLGAIRTTGETTTTREQYWTYAGGGNIVLDVFRNVGKKLNDGTLGTAQEDTQWDYITAVAVPKPGGRPGQKIYYGQFSANYEGHMSPSDNPTAGIAAMGGGNVAVRTGGDFMSQAGAFGDGDLSVHAGGDIKGRFLNGNGRGELDAMGNIGSYGGDPKNRVQIELLNSRFNATAGGEIQISAILNPTLASDKNPGYENNNANFMNCTYTPDTSISLKAGTDVTIAGKSSVYSNINYSLTETALPATVKIEAGEDISLLNSMTLASSPSGSLRLFAGRDIRGADKDGNDVAHVIMMSDIAPEYWYGLQTAYTGSGSSLSSIAQTWISERTATETTVNYKHGYCNDADKQASAKPLHYNDDQPIEVSAGRDIRQLKMFFPKEAEVMAKRDIISILYEGQNIHPEDVSKIEAGGDISMEYVRTNTYSGDVLEGLVQGGPGVFFVQAGGSIDLGILQEGIQAIGNGRYPQLGTEKSSVVIVSGYSFEKTADDVSAFFAKIQKAGDDYAQLLADGKLEDGANLLSETREETIYPFLGEPSGTGDINMTSSQIGTSIGKSDIFIVANGAMNLGKTALPTSGKIGKKTGITTGGGGAINIFSSGDVNVNESRVMTFYGGDITIWSDQGSINAGRGSRAAVSASPPTVNEDGTQVFSPPAIGSGIRAVTYGENAPEPGNIHLFAPSGVIDAGEAGVAGGKVILAAPQVLNVANISFSSGSVGVPKTSEGTAGIGTLSGSSAAMQSGQLTSEGYGAGVARAKNASQMIEDIIAKWLDVKVIDFIEEE